MTDDSRIVLNADNTVSAYVGPDATKLAQAIMLRSALMLYKRGGIKISRAWSLKGGLFLAGQFSKKSYTRSQVDVAIEDLTVWIETMKSALPVEQEK